MIVARWTHLLLVQDSQNSSSCMAAVQSDSQPKRCLRSSRDRRMSRLSLMGVAFAAIWATWAVELVSSQAESSLEFYMHDNIFVPNPSGIAVAGPNGSTTVFAFGTVIVIDDALTQDASPSSKALGRGQGTYMVSALDSSSLLLTFTAVFSDRNGTLSFHGADKITVRSREIAVVGGTGIYRFAQGYALITTTSNVNFSAVLHFNVTVQLPNGTGIVGGASPGQSSSINSSAISASLYLFTAVVFACLTQVLLLSI